MNTLVQIETISPSFFYTEYPSYNVIRFHYVSDYTNEEYEIVKSRYDRYEKTKNLVYSMNLLVEKFNMEI